MKKLYIDLETYSSEDLKYGVYKYADSPDFEIMLFAYAYDDEPVQVIDLMAGEEIPEQVLRDIEDPDVLKIAHNAAFERICLSKHLKKDSFLSPESWACSMVQATFCGIPSSLAEAGKTLQIKNQKMAEGKTGISLFSAPVRKKRNYPADHPEKWEEFKAYCIRDVEAEREIYKKLEEIQQLPERERKLYQLDQRINDLGIGVDLNLVKDVSFIQKEHEKKLGEKSEAIAPGLNPRSNKQMLEWLKENGFDLDNIQAKTIDKLMEILQPDSSVYQLLDLRKEIAKAAVKKFSVFEKAAVDDRIRGTLQFYGAGTGRWSGRVVQPQNMARPIYHDIENIRSLVKERDIDKLEDNYESVNDALASIVRTVIVPDQDKKLLMADFSAIEARVLAWLAGEDWVLDAFRNGEDIYCMTASQMYGVPVEKHGANSELRQYGKIASLACGYGGSIAALKTFGADSIMSEEEMMETVNRYRKANSNIVRYWRRVESAFKKALRASGKVELSRGVWIENKPVDGKNVIHIHLPSGRDLIYYNASLDPTGRIIFEGRGLSGKNEILNTWGGKLAENITQAIARDCLAESLLDLDEKGFEILFHVHDEVIVQDKDENRMDEMIKVMEKPIDFFENLELKAEGFSADYYEKG